MKYTIKRKRFVLGGIIAAVLALLTVAMLGLLPLPILPRLGAAAGTPATTLGGAPPIVAAVEYATLTEELRLHGQLTFGEPVPLPLASGVITALPAPGVIVEKGEAIYSVNGEPVTLWAGEMPFWRDLGSGDRGADVTQLQDNLAALGYFTGTPNGVFGAATTAAVRAWQRGLGVEDTGRFAVASVVVVPPIPSDDDYDATTDVVSSTSTSDLSEPGGRVTRAAIRIHEVTARLGESGVSPATFTEQLVYLDVTITEAQSHELQVGTPVTVELPDGTEVATTIAAVSVGNPADGTPPSARIDFPDQTAVQATAGRTVRITVNSNPNQTPTLVIPAVALLATADGFAVEVWDAATGAISRVPVAIGLSADARVQILSGDLAPGVQVVLAR